MALPSGCLPSGCLNPRWAPSHHLFASAAHASTLEGLGATVYTHTLPPRLPWGGHAVYEYRSKAECLAVLRTNSAADFLMPSGRLMTDESKGELLDQIFRERQRADGVPKQQRHSESEAERGEGQDDRGGHGPGMPTKG